MGIRKTWPAGDDPALVHAYYRQIIADRHEEIDALRSQNERLRAGIVEARKVIDDAGPSEDPICAVVAILDNALEGVS